jgi:hypothetical protein
MPFLAIADTGGVSITRGFTDNCSCCFKSQWNVSLVSRNQCFDHIENITSGKKMRFDFVGGYAETRLGSIDERIYDNARRNFTKSHQNQIKDADLDTGKHSGNPKVDRNEIHEKEEKDDYRYYNE